MRAHRIIKRIESAGGIHLDSLPFKDGQTVEIIILPLGDDIEDLARLCESALGFWDNDIDDEVWNDAASSTRPSSGSGPVQ